MATVSTLLSSIKDDLKIHSNDTTRDAELIRYMNRILQGLIAPQLLRFRSDIGRTEWVTDETAANIRRHTPPTGLLVFGDIWCVEIDHSGTMAAGGTVSSTLDSGASSSDDAYNALLLRTTGGTGPNQQTQVYDYTGSTRVALFSPTLTSTTGADTAFAIFDPANAGGGVLTQRSLTEITQSYTGTGKPTAYALDGSSLILGPTPDDIYVLWGYYWGIPTSLTATGDTVPYSSIFDHVVVESVSLYALKRDEYNISIEAAMRDMVDSEVAAILTRRGDQRAHLPLRGMED